MTCYFVPSACPYKFACSRAFRSDIMEVYLSCIDVYCVRRGYGVSIYIISNYILYSCIPTTTCTNRKRNYFYLAAHAYTYCTVIIIYYCISTRFSLINIII